MKKKLKMINLDCANCAMKMQEAVSKLDGVNDVQIKFIKTGCTWEKLKK